MHEIEPYYHWREKYVAAEDDKSPFYGRVYSEFEYSQKVYNYFIHPQWDYFGSPTLYLKVLMADYDEGYAIIELIGEWNDCLHNDIMFLKREVIDEMIPAGIHRFILICENVLNFHGDDDSYYEEWYEDIMDEGGWIVFLNTLPHVAEEMQETDIDHYAQFGNLFNDINWRPHKPERIYEAIEGLLQQGVKRVF